MSDQSQLIRCSKFLSFALRHKPAAIGLTIDHHGWASVNELIEKAKPQFLLTRELIEETVSTNDKQRFSLSIDRQRIRANQGHSIKVDVGLEQRTPPDTLYHGTASRFLPSIREQGLRPGHRQHVHLSNDKVAAYAVGKRYGKPIVLEIDAKTMHARGISFFFSENSVWLVDHVPISFIRFPGSGFDTDAARTS